MIRALMLGVALATAIAGCARVEEPILGEFFHASRLRDRTALQKLATVSFDPAVQGIVTGFEITGVSTRRERDAAMKDVAISAPVTLMSGQVIEKRLVVTIQQMDGRWMVVAITDAAGPGPSTPPS
jgi:hypothetical protein